MNWPILLLLALGCLSSASAEPIRKADLARKLLDSEAIYTVADGLKPISEGFWQARFSAELPTSAEIENVRALLADLPLGPDCEAGVHVFAAIFHQQRFATAYVAHRPALRKLIARRSDAFAPLGITIDSSPREVLERIDRASPSARWRGFGLVFGYPEYAVEFFVRAGEEQARTKKFVERDFIHLPTFAGKEGHFVYAVPKGHQERTEDRELRVRAEAMFARYQRWRAIYMIPDGAGAERLLYDWMAPAVPLFFGPQATSQRTKPRCRR